MSMMNLLKAAVRPLKSRKVRVALTTVVAAYAAEFGFGVSEELVLTILAVGTALILGIAHEDHAQKAKASPVDGPREDRGRHTGF